MHDRPRIDAFLDAAGWGQATLDDVAGDASARSYQRVSRQGRSAILMHIPHEQGRMARDFVDLAGHLKSLGLSAPEILNESPDGTLTLMEDLGDDLFARVIPRDPSLESDLYAAAVDVLVHLRGAPVPAGLGRYEGPMLTDMAALAYRWYRAGVLGQDNKAEAAFRDQFAPLCDALEPEPAVLVHRDYHAENLLWLPQRSGLARVGILDFQDALAGHPAYDLVSLLKDARRDVPAEIETAMIARYVTAADCDPQKFQSDYALLGAQRNLRILGVFARLSMHYGKPRYVDLIPRVWGHMMACLSHPDLSSLKQRVQDDLPPPDAAALQRLKDLCATVPSP